MMSAMNSKERLVAAMKGNPVDHIPFAPFLAYFWEAQPNSVQQKGQLEFLKQINADPLWRCSPALAAWEWSGVEVSESWSGNSRQLQFETPVGTVTETYRYSENGKTAFHTGHMIKKPEDYKVFQWMEEHTTIYADDRKMKAHLDGDGSEGLSLACPVHERSAATRKTAFQNLVEHYVGTEQLTYDLMDHPALVEETLSVMRQRNKEAVMINAQCDEYQFFLSFEDTSTQNYSPQMYADYIAPEISEWVQILSESDKAYIQHACGHLRNLVSIIQAQGIWGIESISPPSTGNIEVGEARAITGDAFGFIGGIEPVKLQDSDIEELPEYLEEVLHGAGDGFFVLANADSCPPGVSVEKLKFISEWAKAHT